LISADLNDAPHIRGRISKALQLAGMLRRNLLGNRNVWKEVKRQILTGMILPTLLDGIEHCVISAAMFNEMTSAYHRIIRSCLRLSPHSQRKHRVTSEETLRRMGMEPLHHYVDMKILGYAGHVERMGPKRIPKRMRDCHMTTTRPRGGPPKRHNKQVHQSLTRKGIDIATWRSVAQDKTRWAKSIRAPSVLKSARLTTKKRRAPAPWELKPDLLIGKIVEKKFGRTWNLGTIVDFDTDENTGEYIWHILYDDGDREDNSAAQLDKIICWDMSTIMGTVMESFVAC
jgi:hypothetical protein